MKIIALIVSSILGILLILLGKKYEKLGYSSKSYSCSLFGNAFLVANCYVISMNLMKKYKTNIDSINYYLTIMIVVLAIISIILLLFAIGKYKKDKESIPLNICLMISSVAFSFLTLLKINIYL